MKKKNYCKDKNEKKNAKLQRLNNVFNPQVYCICPRFVHFKFSC